MNRVEILGNFVRDPEVRYTSGENQLAVCRFTIAVQRPVKKTGEPEADFINCIAFGKTGENISKFFTKGRKIAVCGKIRTGSYIKDDRKIYFTDIVVESFDFCDNKSSAVETTEPLYSVPEDIDEEDLPF